MKYISAFLILGLIATNASAACVKPVGTYTGSFKGQYTVSDADGQSVIHSSGQMSLRIPEKGNWVPTTWSQNCIKTFTDGAQTGEDCFYWYEPSNTTASVSRTKAIVGREKDPVYPGNGTKNNQFDTKTCHGLIKHSSGVFVSYTISENGDRLELLYFTSGSSAIQSYDMFPIILNRS